MKHNQFRLLTLSKPESMFKTKAERLLEAASKKSKKDPFSNELADPQTFTDIIAMRSEAKGFTKAVKATIFALSIQAVIIQNMFTKADQITLGNTGFRLLSKKL